MVKSGNKIVAIFSIFALIILSLSACNNKSNTGTGPKSKDETQIVETPFTPLGNEDGFDIAAQDSEISLLLNREYGLILLKNNKSSAIIPTTGYDKDLSGIALENTKNVVKSNIVLEFYDNRNKETIFNSYEHSIKDNQVKYSSIKIENDSGIENGFRAYYTIGKPDTRTALPDVMTAKTMDELVFPKIDNEQKEMIKLYYSYFDPAELDEATINELVKKYPLVKEEPIYVAKKIGIRFQIRLTQIFENAGLTIDVIQEEYEKIGYKTAYEEQPCFEVPVDYTIINGSLTVSVDCSRIKYNNKLYRLTTLQLMPYFGSMNYNPDGYMFVPDGSGILINGDSLDKELMDLSLYGVDINDNLTKADEEIVVRNAIMPVFGVKNQSEALFAIIEEGSGIAALSIGTSAHPTTLNHIAPTFNLMHRESTESKGMVIGTNIVRYSTESYLGNISIRYNLLSQDKANYTGMAEYYRNYLFSDRDLQEKETPFYITSIGTVNRNERFLGMPVVKQRALTNASQAKQMLQTFIDKGVDNITFNYNNWINDELDSKVPTRAKPSRAIGGKKGLNELSKFAKQNGIELFLNLQLTHASKDSYLGGFNKWSHSAKALDGSNTFEEGFYLSPDNTYKAAEKLKKDVSGLDYCKISLNTLGSYLYSDYSENNVILRDEAIIEYQRTAEALSGDSLLMTDVGNAYILPYVSDITYLPLTGSRYSAESKSVPFVPMVLHGYVNYAGEPLNLQTDKKQDFLRSIEYGAGLLFLLNDAKAEMLKNTLYTDLFSSEYSVWTDAAAGYYNQAKKVYESTAGAKMIGNQEVDKGIFVTDYDNGTSVYVNYNTEDKAINGHAVPKESYVVVKR
ncbi:MAG: DUF5696 domain-containing protein [Oscillospiraceae bacterium]|nr:DUF5696 domain-containing protein [Oscillospiraceae bacterium]MDD4413521.1 DUF5696 domain-containing protein [Oscillospiraceae bacterium]